MRFPVRNVPTLCPRSHLTVGPDGPEGEL